MSGDKKIRVGSRKSELALIQTRHVIALLKKIHPETEFEIVTMSTLGDKVLDIPLPKIGEKSLFTKELETALITGCVDFVVHSLKDLPTTLPDGMAIGAVLTREDPRDALVLQKDLTVSTLDQLPKGSTIGTSSLRRTAQLARKHPHLKVENIRGNLNTRLKKLDDLGIFQGIVLAAAGLVRMGWDSRINQIFEKEELLYAVGQGALAVECRQSDFNTINLLRPLYDAQTALRILAERSFLKTLGGGCSAPVAVSTELSQVNNYNKQKLTLTGAVWSLDGTEELVEEGETEIEVKDGKRCAVCPLGYKREDLTTEKNVSSCSKGNCSRDIECLNKCTFLTSQNNESASKRPKLDDNLLLRNDPHEHCPVQIPVGSDFMGKCPYLETVTSGSSIKKCPVAGEIIEAALDSNNLTQCPVFRNGKVQVLPEYSGLKASSNGVCPYKEQKLYCGLVAHVDVPIAVMEETQQLGERIAQSLMKNGAVGIMEKAQAHIRGAS